MLRTSGLALLWSCVAVVFSAFASAEDAAADKVSFYKQILPAGSLSLGDELIGLKDAKPLPSSD